MKLTSFVCLFLLTTATLAPMHTVAQANQSQGSPIFSRFQGPPLARTGRIWAAAHRSVSPQAPVLNFAPAVAYDSGGQNPLFVATGDLNGDGKGDLVVANTSSDTVGVLLGNGDGTFQVAVEYGSGGQFPYSLAIADVNGDGKLDLLITNYCSFNDPGCGNGTNGLIGVLLGRGDGTFSPAATYDSGGFEVQSVAVSDLNSDGKPDLVTANVCASASSCSSATMGVLLGNGDGTFRPAVVYALNGQYAVSVATGDVNGDGNPDVAVATVNYSSTDATIGGIEVLKGNGDGTFQTAVHYSSGAFESIGVAVADVKGNGKLDLLAASLCTSSDSKGNCVGSGTVSVLLGNGDGTFGTAATYATGGNFAYHVVAADMNGDGKLDLITANYCFGSDVNCGSGTDGIAGILLGNGDGTFQTAAVYDSGGKGPRSVAIADVNGDGRPDIAAPNEHAINGSSDGSIGVLLNVSPWPASISVNSSPNPSNLGQVVTFTTTLTSQIVGIPTGTVTFFDGATSLGSSSLNSSGVAVLSISTLAVGTRSITAVYSGDANFAASTSPVLSQVVQGAVAVISPTAINFGNQTVGMTSSSQTVTLTNTGNVTLTLSSIAISLNNGSATQTNNCGAVLMAGAACTVNLFWIPGKAGSMTGNLTFTDNAANSPQVVSLSGTEYCLRLRSLRLSSCFLRKLSSLPAHRRRRRLPIPGWGPEDLEDRCYWAVHSDEYLRYECCRGSELHVHGDIQAHNDWHADGSRFRHRQRGE